jgi:hypothetical protein
MERQIKSSLSDHHDGRVQNSADLVVEKESCYVGGVHLSFHSRHSPLHGRVPEELGAHVNETDFRYVVYG